MSTHQNLWRSAASGTYTLLAPVSLSDQLFTIAGRPARIRTVFPLVRYSSRPCRRTRNPIRHLLPSPSAPHGSITDMTVPAALANYLAAPLSTRSVVLGPPSAVPRAAGVYGWWFDELPDADIVISGCATQDRWALLYAGISPKAPPRNGGASSRQTLQSRIRTHYTGNAAGSTLRLTLGCLLADRLSIALRRYGSGSRRHFGAGERDLSRWMAEHARVSWLVVPTPWIVEHELIAHLDLPLNLDQNSNHAFYGSLRQRRADAARVAEALPVLPNPGVGGSRID